MKFRFRIAQLWEFAYLKLTFSKIKPSCIGLGKGRPSEEAMMRGSISKKSKKSFKYIAPCDTAVKRDRMLSSNARNCRKEPAKKVRSPMEILP
jgi:hypothetical protein